MVLRPIPAFSMPVDKILISAGFYKGKIFFVGDQGRRNTEFVEVNFMTIQFIVETKSLPFIADLADAGGNGEEAGGRGWNAGDNGRGRGVVDIPIGPGGEERIMSKDILDIRVQQFLVLLLMI